MGSSTWDAKTYRSRMGAKAASGTPTFHYYDSVKKSGDWKAHDSLDPSKLNGAGKNIREAHDSDEHPESLPIAVIFDVTGSMGGIPMTLQTKLPQLHGILQRKGYVEHPQILFGAIGDATGYPTSGDRVPLQIGQFEAGNEMDEALENIVLEGGGGGGNHESYQLAAYYMARHTELDSLTKRGKKGYLFFIGDERLYDHVDRKQVEAIIGDAIQEDIPTKQIFTELQEKYEVFFLFAAQGSYEAGSVLKHHADPGVEYWSDLLGQNAIILDDADAVCETIALTLGLMEGVTDLAAGEKDLVEAGASTKSAKSASKALATVGAGAGAVAKSEGGSLPGLN